MVIAAIAAGSTRSLARARLAWLRTGRSRAAEDLGDLRVRQVGEVAQDDHRSLFVGQAGQNLPVRPHAPRARPSRPAPPRRAGSRWAPLPAICAATRRRGCWRGCGRRTDRDCRPPAARPSTPWPEPSAADPPPCPSLGTAGRRSAADGPSAAPRSARSRPGLAFGILTVRCPSPITTLRPPEDVARIPDAFQPEARKASP